MLKKLPKEEWPEMKIKISAMEALNGRCQDWGYKRKWQGNYLASVSLIYMYIL